MALIILERWEVISGLVGSQIVHIIYITLPVIFFRRNNILAYISFLL